MMTVLTRLGSGRHRSIAFVLRFLLYIFAVFVANVFAIVAQDLTGSETDVQLFRSVRGGEGPFGFAVDFLKVRMPTIDDRREIFLQVVARIIFGELLFERRILDAEGTITERRLTLLDVRN